MKDGKSILSEMPLEHLHDWLWDVWRDGILHENNSIQTCTLLKCLNDLVEQKILILFIIHGTGNRIRKTHLLGKKGLIIYTMPSISTTQLVTFGECIGTV